MSIIYYLIWFTLFILVWIIDDYLVCKHVMHVHHQFLQVQTFFAAIIKNSYNSKKWYLHNMYYKYEDNTLDITYIGTFFYGS